MEQQIDLLADVHATPNTDPVSMGIRFADWVIDFIVFYGLCYGAGMTIGMLMPELAYNQINLYVITYLIYLFYYTVIEGATNGRTLGKLVTGSKAVKEDGSDISWNDAIMRSLIRLVPFEALSALNGYPWHDRWTNTIVVKNKIELF